MQETETPQNLRPGKSDDEIALELMKFIAAETGYAKVQGAVGFSGKTAKSADELVESLLGLFERCRRIVKQ
jgi:hypothetical protein